MVGRRQKGRYFKIEGERIYKLGDFKVEANPASSEPKVYNNDVNIDSINTLHVMYITISLLKLNYYFLNNK